MKIPDVNIAFYGALAVALTPNISMAQATDVSKGAEVLEEVTVIGYAGSVERAIANKRNAEVISDGIAAEDIGKFPQENIAEALQHITGVQITRSNGEGQFASVRGLDPKFTTTLYNGRQLPTASGSRAFDFQVLTGNVASRVDIYKTPTSEMLETGLAGMVNIQSFRPLDSGDRVFAISAAANYDNQAESTKPQLSAFFSDVFLDGRLGWMVNFEHSERSVDLQQYTSTGNNATPITTLFEGAFIELTPVYGLSIDDIVGENKRDSIVSVLQFQATDSLQLRVDTLYSKFDQELNAYTGYAFYPGNPPFAATTSYSIDEQNIASSWSGTQVFGYNYARYNDYPMELSSTAVGASLSLGAWTIDGEVSYGKATEKETNVYIMGATQAGRGAAFYYDTVDPNGPMSFGFNSGFDPNDAQNYPWYADYGSYKAPTTDEIKGFRADASRPVNWGIVRNVEFGVNYQDRTLARTPNWFSVSAAQVAQVIGGTDGVPNFAPYIMNYANPTFFSGYDGPARFPRGFSTINLNSYFNAFPLERQVEVAPPVQTLGSTMSVTEKSQALYAKIDFASDGNRLSGNAGVRLVRTEENPSAYGPAPSATIVYANGNSQYSESTFVSAEHSYTNVLPSLNLSYALNDSMNLRFAAAEVMQRPDLNVLAQASSLTLVNPPPEIPGLPWFGSISKGNPELKPFISDQMDLSWEWYFDERSMLSAAAFYKKVKNFVVTTSSTENADAVVGAPPPGSTVPVGTVLPATFTVFQPVNAETTTLKGAELNYRQSFSFLPGVLRNIGTELNWTHLWPGDLVTAAGGPALPVDGVSEDSYNIGLYYDDGRFSINALYNYRSDFAVSAAGGSFGDGKFAESYGQLDLSANFRINDNFSISGSVVNALNTELIEKNSYDVVTYYGLSGTHYRLGFRYSL